MKELIIRIVVSENIKLDIAEFDEHKSETFSISYSDKKTERIEEIKKLAIERIQKLLSD